MSHDESGVVAIGSLLDGRYRVDALLGSGGMGRVYKAEHTGIGRKVAIKVLHSRLGKTKEATSRFQREALASGRLDHPNIVGVSDFGVLDDGSLYLVMEALEGEGLGSRLEREKRIPWQEALQIIRGVLAGLRHAHDKGVVHRDIKPDNIFLANKEGETFVKILDFGIAKLYAGSADDPAQTRAGLTVGTPAYLSPEQAVGGAITPATDLYSTSIVLYEMLTGRPPYTDDDPMSMLTAHVSRDPPPFSEVASDLQLPAGIEDVIQAGLAKVSSERISSAVDYLQRLETAVHAAGYDLSLTMPRMSGSVSQPIPTVPQGPYATPSGGVRRVQMTPMPTANSAATPMPFGAANLGAAPTLSLESLPAPARQVTLVEHIEKEPLPPKLKRTAIWILGAAIVIAAALFVFGRKTGGKTTIVTVPIGMGVDNETRLKAALHDLENGKTCADRKAAIPVLAEIGDERAVEALKKARHRMRGGVLGIGDNNTNACLKSDAEKVLQDLGETLR